MISEHAQSWSLVRRLALRQVQMRYRDSLLGIAWAVVAPLVLVLVYNVIYTTVFKTKWFVAGNQEENYALVLYSGLVLFLLVAEVLNTATVVIQNNAVLVKRTTMPTSLIPLSASVGALVSFLFSIVPFVGLYLIAKGVPPWTILLYPVIVAITWLLATGAGLLIAGVSPYFRDLQQVMPLVTTCLLFLSPIFYPVASLPDPLRGLLVLVNPLMTLIPASQDLVFVGQIPPLLPLAIWAAVGVALFALGRAAFSRIAKGFADVV